MRPLLVATIGTVSQLIAGQITRPAQRACCSEILARDNNASAPDQPREAAMVPSNRTARQSSLLLLEACEKRRFENQRRCG